MNDNKSILRTSFRNLNTRSNGKSLKESMATTMSILTLPSFRTTTSGNFLETGCASVSWLLVYRRHHWRHQSMPLYLAWTSFFFFVLFDKCLSICFIAYTTVCDGCFMEVWHHSKPSNDPLSMPKWTVIVNKFPIWFRANVRIQKTFPWENFKISENVYKRSILLNFFLHPQVKRLALEHLEKLWRPQHMECPRLIQWWPWQSKC